MERVRLVASGGAVKGARDREPARERDEMPGSMSNYQLLIINHRPHDPPACYRA